MNNQVKAIYAITAIMFSQSVHSETLYWGPNIADISYWTIAGALTGVPVIRNHGDWLSTDPITGYPLAQQGNWYSSYTPTTITESLSDGSLISTQILDPNHMRLPEKGDSYDISYVLPDTFGMLGISAVMFTGESEIITDTAFEPGYTVTVKNPIPAAQDVDFSSPVATLHITDTGTLPVMGTAELSGHKVRIDGRLLGYDNDVSTSNARKGRVLNSTDTALHSGVVDVFEFFNLGRDSELSSASGINRLAATYIQNDGNIHIGNDSTLILSVANAYNDDGERVITGEFANHGVVSIDEGSEMSIHGGVRVTDLNELGNGVILNGGSITGAGDAHGDELITNGVNITGYGSIGEDMLSVVNGAVIESNISGKTLKVDVNDGGLINKGVMRANNGGRLEIQDSAVDNTAGSIEALDGSEITLTDVDVDNAGSAIVSQGTGAIEFSGNSSVSGGEVKGVARHARILDLNDVTLSGELKQSNRVYHYLKSGTAYQTKTNIAGTLSNQGVFSLDATNNGASGYKGSDSLIVANSATTVIDGAGTIDLRSYAGSAQIIGATGSEHLITDNTIRASRGVYNYLGKNSLSLTNRGEIIAEGAGSALEIDVNDDVLANEGVLRADSGGRLNLSGDSLLTSGEIQVEADSILYNADVVTQTAGASVVNGELRANLLDVQGGRLSGSGVVVGDVQLMGGASLDPGNSPGTFTVNGNYLQGPGSEISFEIGGSESGLHDILNVSGVATFEANTSVNIYFTDSYAPTLEDTFDLILASSLDMNLEKTNVSVFGLAPGFEFDYLFESGGFSLQAAKVAAVPVPGSLWLFASGMVGLAGIARRKISDRCMIAV